VVELLRYLCNLIFVFYYSGGQKGDDKVLPDPLQKGMSQIILLVEMGWGLLLQLQMSLFYQLLTTDKYGALIELSLIGKLNA